MSQITIGEVSWEDVQVPGGGRGDGESDFMQLDLGDNRGRVLSNPQQFAAHWVVDETGKNRKVNCATSGCPVCQRGQDGDKPQARWLIKFLSRKDSKVKLLEIGSQILKGLKILVNNPDWGAVSEYDVNIVRGPKGAQPLYTVTPGRRVPLTTEEKQALSTFNERVEISRFVEAPTPADVAKKLGWAAPEDKVVSNDFSSSGKTAPAKKPPMSFDFE